MREALGPFLASLTQARRRRAYRVLVAAMIGVFGLIAWSNYPAYRDQRARVDKLAKGEINIDQLIGGYGCDESSCRLIDIHGHPLGPQIPIPTPDVTQGQPGEPCPPEAGPKCEQGNFGGPPITQEQIQKYIPDLTAALRKSLAEDSKALSPRASVLSRIRSLGTFWGVLFAVIIAATLIGAEWRWGVWRTLLTHEPRRGRLLVAKFATVWVMIALTFALIIAVTGGLDAVFRTISSVGTRGGPTTVALVRNGGKALLSLEVYATFSAMFTMLIRTSFAGVGSLILLLGDGIATHKWEWLRVATPSQQIARLLPINQDLIGGGYVWFPRVISKGVCRTSGGFTRCREVLLRPIPQWRAVAVLLGWILLASLIAWVFLRARDVPQ